MQGSLRCPHWLTPPQAWHVDQSGGQGTKAPLHGAGVSPGAVPVVAACWLTLTLEKLRFHSRCKCPLAIWPAVWLRQALWPSVRWRSGGGGGVRAPGEAPAASDTSPFGSGPVTSAYTL